MGCESCRFHKNDKKNINSAEISASDLDSCNKLNVYDWLNDISDPSVPELAEVRFKNTRKEFYINSGEVRIKSGDIVAVEATRGHDIGIVSLTGRMAYMQFRRKVAEGDIHTLKKIYRKASTHDMSLWTDAKEREQPTMIKARQIAGDMDLQMKIGDVEFQGDRSAATFYYTADKRVDFRELIKVYEKEFGVRILMHQIGMRQEAGRIGGIGSCGRELCCSTWKTKLNSVSIDAARYQELSPNAQKLVGQCGKLKCCLMYELEVYLEALDDFPEELLELETKKGIAYPGRIEALRKTVWYSYEKQQHQGLIPLSTERIKQIIMMNKKGSLPEDLIESDRRRS